MGDAAVRFGYGWAVLMFASGALSPAFAFTVGLDHWLLLMTIRATGSNVALFAIEFIAPRLIRRQHRPRLEALVTI